MFLMARLIIDLLINFYCKDKLRINKQKQQYLISFQEYLTIMQNE